MRKIFFIVVITPMFVFSQQNKEVLFLGNSYTYVNDLPNMVKQIALSFGDSLNYDQNTPGGATLQMHSRCNSIAPGGVPNFITQYFSYKSRIFKSI